MSVVFQRPIERLVSDDELACWRMIPTTVIADELNRSGGMSSRIRAIGSSESFVGEALTVHVMAGDNLTLHIAVNRAHGNMVIVVDAGGYGQTAVWGEVLHTAAQKRQVAGIVIDGAIRDRAALRVSNLPLFAIGSTPNGPHKGWGGEINGVIQCGGVAVSPNDVIVGDADGVTVIPNRLLRPLLPKCRDRLAFESQILEATARGESTLDLFGIDDVPTS